MEITLTEYAKRIDRPLESVRKLARTNRLPGAYRKGNRWLVSLENRVQPAEQRPFGGNKELIAITGRILRAQYDLFRQDPTPARAEIVRDAAQILLNVSPDFRDFLAAAGLRFGD